MRLSARINGTVPGAHVAPVDPVGATIFASVIRRAIM